MQSLDQLYIYTEVLINCLRMQASVVRAAEDTLSQAGASANLDQSDAISIFKTDQPELQSGRPNTLFERQSTVRCRSQVESVTRRSPIRRLQLAVKDASLQAVR